MSSHNVLPPADPLGFKAGRRASDHFWVAIAAEPFDRVLAAVALLLVVGAYFVLLRLNVYGLDEVQYYADFTFKLREEGRWLNALLHYVLRSIPLPVGSLAYVVLLWLLMFRIAANFTTDRLSTVLIASLLSIGTPFVDQSLWPVSLLPTLLVMLGLAWLSKSGTSPRLVYVAGGILLFGCMQNYYFLLPLYYMNQLATGAPFTRQSIFQLFNHLAWWVVGCLIGVGVALLAVYLMVHQVGVHPAAWRKPMPVHDFNDLARNVGYVWMQFVAHSRWFLFKMTRWSYIAFGGIALLILYRLKDWRFEVSRLGILVVVAASFFAFSVPLAPVIQDRSLVGLSIALALLLLVPHSSKGFAKWLSIALLLWVSWNLAGSAYAGLRDYQQHTDFVLRKIDGVLPLNPGDYRAIAIVGTASPDAPDALILNRPPMMRAIVLSTGAKQFLDCQPDTGDPDCKVSSKAFHAASRQHAEGIEYLGTVNNIAVLSVGNQ